MNHHPASGPTPVPVPRHLVAGIISLSSMGIIGYSAIAPALPDLAEALDVSASQIGLLQSAVALPGAILSIALGWLADRYGRRPIVLIGILAFALAGAAGYWVHSFWPLVGLRSIQGIGAATLLGMPVVLIGDLFAPPARIRILGYNLASVTLAGALAPTVGGALATSDPFRPFLLYGLALGLLVVVPMLPSFTTAEPASPLRHMRQAFHSMRSRGTLVDFVGTLPMVAIASIIFGGFVFVGTPLHLEDAYGMPVAGRGLIISVASIVAAGVSMRLGALTSRFPAATLISSSMVALAAGLWVVALPLPAWGVVVGLALLGYAIAAVYPLLQAEATAAAGDAYRGTAVGIFTTSLRVAQAIGPVLAGALFVSVGGRWMYAIGGAAAAVVAISWKPVRELAHRRSRTG